jgi:plastocyanin
MFRTPIAFSVACAAAMVVAACSSHSGGGSGLVPSTSMALPAIDRDLSVTATLPKNSIGEELPSEGLGTIRSARYAAVVGGFTQMKFSQTLGFVTGTKITIHNLSKTTAHTLNVVKVISGAPARFPKNPALSTSAHGNGVLAAGFASGVINPGKTVTVTLSKPGIYLIGCAFHYSLGMRDVLVVGKTARPGAQATPDPKKTGTPPPNSTPTPPPSGGGGW